MDNGVADTTTPTLDLDMTVGKSKLSNELGRRLVKGPRKVTAPYPVPCDKSARIGHLNVLQINIEGLQHKTTELLKLLSDQNVHICMIQETVLPKKEITTSGFTQYSCKCQNCRGIMTLVRNDVQAEVINTPIEDVDIQKIDVWIDRSKHTLFNVYCPPGSNAGIPLQETTYRRSIIAGDFNAHTPSLGYDNFNRRGRDLEDLCNSSNLILEQDMESKPTLLHKAHKTTSRPDLTLISADIYEKTSVQVLDSIGSDHCPILTSIQTKHKSKAIRRPLWNFRKANWKAFADETDSQLGNLDVSDGTEDAVCNKITTAILDAAKKHIPRGNRNKYTPYWNKDLDQAVKSRNKARKDVETNPSTENKIKLNRLTAKVRLLTNGGKREHWKTTCQQLNLNKDGHKAWKLLKNLEGSSRKENPKPLKKNGKVFSNGKMKADIFNQHLSQVSKSTRRRNLDNAMWKRFKEARKSPTCNELPFEKDFSYQEFESAVKKATLKKAPGPDQVTNEMIAHLGVKAKHIALSFINRTWRESKVPSQWRTAKITPVLKKGKPTGQPSSYRPISLTSCFGKIAEKMVNRRLYHWLEQNRVLNNNQAGFRKKSRTEDQLFRMIQNIIDGFQEKKSTTAVFIDLQQAYDRVWKKGLLIKMRELGIHGKMLSWIQAFLSNRTIQTTFDNSTSGKLTIEEGLPQGSSLSCTLFLIFINDLPDYLGVKKALFADDLVIWTSEKYPILARAKLNRTLGLISVYCNFWKLKINQQKTVYTIFSRSLKVSCLDMRLNLNGMALTKDENPTYLGVQLDSNLNLNKFMSNLKSKATKRLSLLKRLATTSWGASKLTLRQLYLGYIRSAMDYALPLQNIASKQTTQTLDRVQNQAAKLICGGMRSTPIAACEIDANIEPMDLRRERSLLEGVERYRRLEEDHPNRLLVDSWMPNKRLKQNSPLDIFSQLEETHHLPPDRKPLKKYEDFPPWTELNRANIHSSLLDPDINKKSDPNILKLCALETIDSYGQDCIHAYTDGSAFKGTSFAGYGAFLEFPDKSSTKISNSCGEHCSNFEAEIIAIKSTIDHLKSSFDNKEKDPSNIVIFTDSLSTLQALEGSNKIELEDLFLLSTSIHEMLTSYGIKISLQWVPGHSDIKGNNIADDLAKQGSRKDQPNKPCSMETTRQLLKQDSKMEWLNRWATGKTGRVMFNEMDKPMKQDPLNQLKREDQSLIFQFRTNHCKLNKHLNRINPQHIPTCRNCNYFSESVHHVLFDCQGLKNFRKELLPIQPSIRNTLYGDLDQLKKTTKFLRLALSHLSYA